MFTVFSLRRQQSCRSKANGLWQGSVPDYCSNPGRLVRELEEENPFVWRFRPHAPTPLVRSITTWVIEKAAEFYSFIFDSRGEGGNLEFALSFSIMEKLTYNTEQPLQILSANTHRWTSEETSTDTHAQLPMLHVYLIKWQLALLRVHHPPYRLYDSPDTSWQILFYCLFFTI